MQTGKIDLALVKGAFRATIQGRTEAKDCICIPLDQLYQGKNNSAYLGIAVIDVNGKWGKAYSIKQNLKKEEYDRLTPEERRSQPFIGDIALPAEQRSSAPAQRTAAVSGGEPTADLPF